MTPELSHQLFSVEHIVCVFSLDCGTTWVRRPGLNTGRHKRRPKPKYTETHTTASLHSLMSSSTLDVQLNDPAVMTHEICNSIPKSCLISMSFSGSTCVKPKGLFIPGIILMASVKYILLFFFQNHCKNVHQPKLYVVGRPGLVVTDVTPVNVFQSGFNI